VEPIVNGTGDVAADTARQRLPFRDQPLPWEEWAAEFRSSDKFPNEIAALIDEVTKDAEDDTARDAIKERLKRVKDLLSFPSRYRRTAPDSDLRAATDTIGGTPRERGGERSGSGSSGGRWGRAGDICTLWVDPEGVPVDEVTIDDIPETVWVTVENGRRTPPALEDRAANYLAEQNLIQANGDFRAFKDMINRWYVRYGEKRASRPVIEQAVREWFEQALVETVLGVQALQGSSEWTPDDIAKALSEEALTSAVMQRYHVDNAVKRALGSKLGPLQETKAAA
jgi:hypothetical protein